MLQHIRANLVLLVLSVILGSVLYPLALLGIGIIASVAKSKPQV